MAKARTEGHKMTIFSLSNLTALGWNSARELCFPMKLFCEFWDVAEAVFRRTIPIRTFGQVIISVLTMMP